MSYQIDASLQQGIPSLRLLDTNSGRERLFWQLPMTCTEAELRDAWRVLFRRLALLSCIDHVVGDGNSCQQTIRIKGRESDVVQNVITADSPPEKTEQKRQSNVVYLPLRRIGAGRWAG